MFAARRPRAPLSAAEPKIIGQSKSIGETFAAQPHKIKPATEHVMDEQVGRLVDRGVSGSYNPGTRTAVVADGGLDTYRHERMHGMTHSAIDNPALESNLPLVGRVAARLQRGRQTQPSLVGDAGRALDELNARLAGPRGIVGKGKAVLNFIGAAPAYARTMSTGAGRFAMNHAMPLAGSAAASVGGLAALLAKFAATGSNDVDLQVTSQVACT